MGYAARVGRFRQLLGLETPTPFASPPTPQFVESRVRGFSLDGTFMQNADALLEQVAGFSDNPVSRRFALSCPPVLRARNLIAGTAGTLDLELRNSKRELDERNWLGSESSAPIEQTTHYALTIEDLWMEQRSYWRVTLRGADGYPTMAEHVDIRNVSEHPITGIPYRIISEDLPFEPDAPVYVSGAPDRSIIRFIGPNPPFRRYAARAIRTYALLEEAARRMAQEPIPLGYFTDAPDVAPLEDDEVQQALDDWEASRRERAWGYVDRGLELKQLQMPTAEQLQLVESRNAAALEIARAAGIDPDYLGIPANSRTYANAEQRRLDLIDFTLNPYLRVMEDRLSMADVTPRGLRARWNVDGFSRGDFASRMGGYATAVSSGVYEVNELRRRENLPDVEEPEPQPVPPALPSTEEEAASADDADVPA